MADHSQTTANDWQAECDFMAEDICMTCLGTGRVNPLTAPPGILCLTSMECPHCEGTGVNL
jgi:DnaJ-class molecular chaperone